MRSDLASITTNLVQILVERDKRVHKNKSEDSITQEDFLPWFSNSDNAKAGERERTKTKKFVGTTKNGLHSIGCSNDLQNTWTEEIWRGQRRSRSDKSADWGWDTGKCSWNDVREKLVESRTTSFPEGQVAKLQKRDHLDCRWEWWMRTKDTITQRRLTWSSYFCIMENVQIA